MMTTASLRVPAADPAPPSALLRQSLASAPCFHEERAALGKLEKIRWPDGAICPHCGAADGIGAVNGRGARPGLKYCCRCRKQFRVTIATVFQHSHIPAHKWLRACLLLARPDGRINAHRLHFILDVTYKTALHIVDSLEGSAAAWLRDHEGWPLPAAIFGGSRDAALPELGRRLGGEDEAWFDRLLTCLLNPRCDGRGFVAREANWQKS